MPRNRYARPDAKKFSYIELFGALTFGLVIFFSFYLWSLSDGEEYVMVANETMLWGQESSMWLDAVVVDDSSSSISVFFLSKDEIPALHLNVNVSQLSEEDTLLPAEYIYFDYYLNTGSKITIKYNSQEGVKILVFKDFADFASWSKGYSYFNYWYEEYTSNSVEKIVELTAPESSTYFIVFMNSFYFSSTAVSFKFSFDKYEYDISGLNATCSEIAECVVPLSSTSSTKSILLAAPTTNNASDTTFYDVKVYGKYKAWIPALGEVLFALLVMVCPALVLCCCCVGIWGCMALTVREMIYERFYGYSVVKGADLFTAEEEEDFIYTEAELEHEGGGEGEGDWIPVWRGVASPTATAAAVPPGPPLRVVAAPVRTDNPFNI